MRLLFAFILLLLCKIAAHAQTNFKEEVNFLFHLVENNLTEDALFYGNKLTENKSFTEVQKDTINYIVGKMLSSSSADSLAINFLSKISINSPFYYYGKFKEIDINLKYQKIESAASNINVLDSSNSEIINQLIVFEKSGVFLLKNQHQQFDSIKKYFCATDTLLKIEQKNMINYGLINKSIKRKSPIVAALSSAIIPGLGKVYAGNNGQAIASFLSVGLIGGIAFENYYKQGIKHPQTIIFGLLTGIFYIGNIWGSAIGVQIVKNEKKLENKNNIMVSMRIPLHKYFK